MMIDHMNHSKEYFHKQSGGGGWIHKTLLYSGTANFYLSYQVWVPHFRKWHPITWLLFIFALLMTGLQNIGELIKELSVPKKDQVYSYWKAPKKSPMFKKDIEAHLSSLESTTFLDDAGKAFVVHILPEHKPEETIEHISVNLPSGETENFTARSKAVWYLQEKCLVVRVA